MSTLRLCLLLLIALPFSLLMSCKSSSAEDAATTSKTTPQDENEQILEKEAFASAIKKSGAVVIDVRQPEEFAQGHIEGAINIDFFDAEFKYKLLDLDRDKKYYLYCKNENRSYRSMKFMETNDFRHVYMLKGGYQEWNTERPSGSK